MLGLCSLFITRLIGENVTSGLYFIFLCFVEDIEMPRDFGNKYCFSGFVIAARSFFPENPLVVGIKSFKY